MFLNSFLNFNKIFLKVFNIFSNLLKHFLKFSEKIIILFKIFSNFLKKNYNFI